MAASAEEAAVVHFSVAVGSTNPCKVAAVEAALRSVFPAAKLTVKGYSVPSGVPDQPMGEDQTMVGAVNRANAAADAYVADCGGAEPSFAVGLEGGVSEVAYKHTPESVRYSCFAWMAIRASESGAPGLPASERLSCSRTASFMLPPAVTNPNPSPTRNPGPP